MSGQQQDSQILNPFNSELVLSPTDVGAIIEGNFQKVFNFNLARDKSNNIWRFLSTDQLGYLKVSNGRQSTIEPVSTLWPLSGSLSQVLPINNSRLFFIALITDTTIGDFAGIFFDSAASGQYIPLPLGYYYFDEIWQGGVWMNNQGSGTTCDVTVIEYSEG